MNHQKDFFEIQRRMKRKTIILFVFVVLFFTMLFGLIGVSFVLSSYLFGFRVIGNRTSSVPLSDLILYVFLAGSAFAMFIAWVKMRDARINGSCKIKQRIKAFQPDEKDHYHRQFMNIVDEIRISAGLPRANAMIIPSMTINSMALAESDGTPTILVTEGLLADCTRDELQAAVAHEIAHVVKGDCYYVTLVCALTGVLDKMKDSMVDEDSIARSGRYYRKGTPPQVFFYAILVMIGWLVLRLMSTLISRHREFNADAVAVQFTRNPKSMARILLRAQAKTSFIGDFSGTYMPLFIVSPVTTSSGIGVLSRLFNTHPPVSERVESLANIAGESPASIASELVEISLNRNRYRTLLVSAFERGFQKPVIDPVPDFEPGDQGERSWSMQDRLGRWSEYVTLQEMMLIPGFNSITRVRNRRMHVEAPAREFNEIKIPKKRKPFGYKKLTQGTWACPRCRTPMVRDRYEGVSLSTCMTCNGHLVELRHDIEKIIHRKEFRFSDSLIQKAEKYDTEGEILVRKKGRTGQGPAPVECPKCGRLMKSRPYTYRFPIPIDACGWCGSTWLDADELELLQILFEKCNGDTSPEKHFIPGTMA